MKKSEISVYDATLQAWESFTHPDELDGKIYIHGIILIAKVRMMTNRPALNDGTIFRELRYLRADGKLNYRVKSRELSIYEKI
jgi:hypothetical protein